MSKCSKLIGIVVGVVLVAGVSFAGIKEDLAFAKAMYASKDFVASQAAFVKIIKDYPNDPWLAYAQLMIGHALVSQGKPDEEAHVAFQKVKDYSNPIADSSWLSAAQISVAYYYSGKHKFAEAMDVLNAIGTNNPTLTPAELVRIQIAIALVLRAQGKNAESNAILIPIVISNSNVAEFRGVFSQVDPKVMTAADYTKFLQDVIKATPAIEANTEYLGRIKSELEKMK